MLLQEALRGVKAGSASEMTSPSHASPHPSRHPPSDGLKLLPPGNKQRQAASCPWHQVQRAQNKLKCFKMFLNFVEILKTLLKRRKF